MNKRNKLLYYSICVEKQNLDDNSCTSNKHEQITEITNFSTQYIFCTIWLVDDHVFLPQVYNVVDI